MERTLRGRPPLDIPLDRIKAALRQNRQVVSAAKELGCSPAYVHKRLKLEGLSLARVLDSLDA